MDTTLFERVCSYVKKNGKLLPCKFRDEWELTLDNGVIVKVAMEDAGYSNSIIVRGFLNACHCYPGEVKYFIGSEKGLLTIAKMMEL